MNLTTTRLLSQQLAGSNLETPEEVVDWMGAMQAQDLSSFPWAVGIRMKRPSLQAVTDAFNRGTIVRSHLFRATWQLATAADLRWMLDLCRTRNRRIISGYSKAVGDGLSEDDFLRSDALIAEITSGRPSIRCSELAQELTLRGCNFDRHQLTHVLARAEIDGVICSGDLTRGERSFAFLEDKIPPGPALDEEEAMMLAARKFFRSHAPATVADFCWWTGLPLQACRRAVAALADELTPVRQQDETFYVHAESRTRGFRRGAAALVPSFDEYIIGYKSRQVVLDPDFAMQAYNRFGYFKPVVVQDGVVVGTWKQQSGGRIEAIDFYGQLIPAEVIGQAHARLTAFLRS